jgi:hypothetical protein
MQLVFNIIRRLVVKVAKPDQVEAAFSAWFAVSSESMISAASF